MRKNLLAVLVVAVAAVIPARASAQEVTQAGAPAMAAVELSVGTAVVDRELTGAADVFEVAAGTLYCYSRVSNATGSQIEHVWYQGDTEMARVKLNIGGSPWRTWSSKKLGDDAAGAWRCDVLQDGKVIQSARFVVQ